MRALLKVCEKGLKRGASTFKGERKKIARQKFAPAFILYALFTRIGPRGAGGAGINDLKIAMRIL